MRLESGLDELKGVRTDSSHCTTGCSRNHPFPCWGSACLSGVVQWVHCVEDGVVKSKPENVFRRLLENGREKTLLEATDSLMSEGLLQAVKRRFVDLLLILK